MSGRRRGNEVSGMTRFRSKRHSFGRSSEMSQGEGSSQQERPMRASAIWRMPVLYPCEIASISRMVDGRRTVIEPRVLPSLLALGAGGLLRVR